LLAEVVECPVGDDPLARLIDGVVALEVAHLDAWS
jgi:hypothetical protein